MTQERKNAIVDDIMALLIQLTDEEAVAGNPDKWLIYRLFMV